MNNNLPATRRRHTIRNLKSGDKIRFLGLRPDIAFGIIESVSGNVVMVVLTGPDGDRWDQEIYTEEVTERLSEFNLVPITPLRLQYLLEQAQPEDDERQQRRARAQEELMDLLDQRQVFRTSNGVWGINPEKPRS